MVSAVSDSLSNMLDLLVHWFEPTLENSFESHTCIWCIHASTSNPHRISDILPRYPSDFGCADIIYSK